MNMPRVYADEDGVWRDDGDGKPSGIRWSEIYKVGIVCIDTITRYDLLLNLDWDWGEYVELNDEWPGFWDVASALTLRLPKVDPSWIARAKQLTPGGSFDVWTRPAGTPN